MGGEGKNYYNLKQQQQQQQQQKKQKETYLEI